MEAGGEKEAEKEVSLPRIPRVAGSGIMIRPDGLAAVRTYVARWLISGWSHLLRPPRDD